MWLKKGELHEPASTQSLLNLVLLDSPIITNYYLLLVLRRYLTSDHPGRRDVRGEQQHLHPGLHQPAVSG